jgi:hypothetical protein
MQAGDQTADSYIDATLVDRGGLRRAAAPEGSRSTGAYERL